MVDFHDRRDGRVKRVDAYDDDEDNQTLGWYEPNDIYPDSDHDDRDYSSSEWMRNETIEHQEKEAKNSDSCPHCGHEL